MRIVIVGAGKVGFSLAQRLSEEGHEITVIEQDEERRLIVQNSLDVMTISGNGASPQFLADYGLVKADLMVAVTDRDEVNMIACMAARQAGIPRTIARVRNQEYAGENQLEFNKALGIDLTINPEMVTAIEISRILLTPAALDVEDFGDGKVRLLEVRIRAQSPFVNIQLKRLTLPDRILVVGILRQNRMIIPNGTDCLLPEDSVFFVGAQESIEEFSEQFAERKTKIQRVMIIGAGRIGRHLAKILDDVGMSIKVIEKSRERCNELAKSIDKGLVLCGDGTDIDLLIEEGVGETDAVVCLTSDDKLNLLLALLAKDLGTQKTIVRVGRGEYMSLMGKVGVDVILSPRLLTAGVILRQVRAGEVVAVSLLEGAKAEAMEIVVSAKSSIIGRKLKDARIPSNMLIGALLRGDELIIPNGYTILQPGDRVVIFTLPSSIKKITKIF
ncbi:Trk system potassium transporter TrkA [Desulfosporosinus sp. BICA1-9]|uniref:Trk system potassium transporter TrkA n=1 Tax=Desulfosporosinus sp. BICA1-9 TaxID=1531958 RepID=UPI00054C6C8C|nr:Trk system potassium transporter TrkA [Desulfosporosinus sp. BICA1-9]KJS48868.1 MAG: potassium transporter TrkA [Peptococcaceae bacterium BRH_c23]KJS85782.1 MAG: potassium transporter TrkA [Desulfosporosinus sp. BICA1-9]HBW34276.1 Trk system potassium transporter TrkA [Desulfosporosinus sp.]